ncbi:MAG: S49 family peptidase [Candidatus Aerophobetes bacterium]|nr:S49 family peptidase [Candidatus Aerophobetes bacterium]
MSFGRIAIIPIEDPIGGIYLPFLGDVRERNLSRIEKCLEQAKKSKRIKAVILKINSPGGKAYSCKRLVERVKEIKKFTVAQIEEIGTSGAYWIASWCDAILADEPSLVGGVGAISIKLDLSEFMRKIGINFSSITSGKYKELVSPFRKSTEEERKIRENQLRLVSQVFIQDIKKRRKLKREEDVLQGRIYR